MRVLTPFFAHQKNCPGGWSGLELTDTLQTCKIIDSVVEITMRTSRLCYQLSFTGTQIRCKDSFQEGIDVCQISLSCISINIVLQRWGGENPLSCSCQCHERTGPTQCIFVDSYNLMLRKDRIM